MATARVKFVKSSSYTDNPSNGYVNSQSVTITGVGAGNGLVLFVANGGSTANITSVSDDKGNTWTKILSRVTPSTDGPRGGDIWVCKNAAAGTTIVTVSTGSNYQRISMQLHEISDADQTTFVQASSYGNDSTYLNNHVATIVSDTDTGLLMGFHVGSNGNATYSASNGSYGPVSLADGSDTSNGSVLKAPTIVGSQTVELADSEYQWGTAFAITIKQRAITPPPGASGYANWYTYGAPPNSTYAARHARHRTQYDATNTYLMKQTGMPSGMPAGAWRVAVPDENSDGHSLAGDGIAAGNNHTFSEGMGYKMIEFAYLSDPAHPQYDSTAKSKFDGLLTYVKYFKDENGLMNWRIDRFGVATGNGGATDGDEDIALALVIMFRIHGNLGSVAYGDEATAYINAIGTYEFYSSTHTNPALRNVILNGDKWDSSMGGSPDWVMPDYFAPAWYRLFYQHTGDSKWIDRINTNYPIMRGIYDSYSTGFIPDHATRGGAPISGQSYIFGYNAVRGSWRLAMDYLWFGAGTNYLAYYFTKKTSDYVKAQSGGVPSATFAEWALDGSSHASYTNNSFVQNYAVASLVAEDNRQFAEDSYAFLVSNYQNIYFESTLASISMLAATGTMKPYAQPPTQRNQTGKARIAKVISNVQLGIARLTRTQPKTQLGRARLTRTMPKTQLGRARLNKTISRTQLGRGRITVVGTKAQLGRSRVATVNQKAQLGRAALLVVGSSVRNQLGMSRITMVDQNPVTGQSRIAKNQSQTQSGTSRITVADINPITGRSRITMVDPNTIQGRARIQIAKINTVLGRANILIPSVRTITGQARLNNNQAKPQTGKAAIKNQVLKVQQGRARLQMVDQNTIQGRSRIGLLNSKTQPGQARVTRTQLRTLTGVSRVQMVDVNIIPGRARIRRTGLYTLLGIARIVQSVTRDQLGRSKVLNLITVQRNQTGQASISYGDIASGGFSGDKYHSPDPDTLNRELYFKIEKLDGNENVVDTKTPILLDGNVQIDYDRINRRSCTFKLAEDLPINWMASRWRLYYGQKKAGEVVYTSLGIFFPLSPSVEELDGGYITRYTGVDKMRLMDKAVTDIPITFTAGTSLKSVATTLFNMINETHVNFENVPYYLATDFTFEEGTTLEHIASTLIRSFPADIYYDENGYAKLVELPVASKRPVQAVFDETVDSILIDSDYDIDSDKYYNRVTVVGGRVDTGIFRQTYSNPTEFARAGNQYVTKFFKEDAATSQAQVNELAARYLEIGVQMPKTISLVSLPIPELDVKQVIMRKNVKYEITGVTIPLDLGTQKIEAGELI